MIFYIIKVYYFWNVYNWWDVPKRKLYTIHWDGGSNKLFNRQNGEKNLVLFSSCFVWKFQSSVSGTWKEWFTYQVGIRLSFHITKWLIQHQHMGLRFLFLLTGFINHPPNTLISLWRFLRQLITVSKHFDHFNYKRIMMIKYHLHGSMDVAFAYRSLKRILSSAYERRVFVWTCHLGTKYYCITVITSSYRLTAIYQVQSLASLQVTATEHDLIKSAQLQNDPLIY